MPNMPSRARPAAEPLTSRRAISCGPKAAAPGEEALDAPVGPLAPPAPGGFAFLPARGRSGSAPLHLDAEGFGRLLDAKRGRYDVILVDLPALDQAAFTRGLLLLLDGWVAVVRWSATPAPAARTVLREEPALARNLLGVVLSDLKPAALGRYTPHDRAAHDA